MSIQQFCKKCFLPANFPKVRLGADGTCAYCKSLSSRQYQEKLQAALNFSRQDELKTIADQIKAHAAKKKSKYDCIIGASGGLDSTYTVYVAKKIMELNPLLVKYDNGLCHELSNKNLLEACRILNVDLRIVPLFKNERGYKLNATKALRNLGIFFSACFSCHYILPSLVYKTAKEENITYVLTNCNEIEQESDVSSNWWQLKSLIVSFLRCNPLKMLKFIWYEILAQFSFVKLKLQFDGFSPRFFRNIFAPCPLKPMKPRFIKRLNVSEYVPWDYINIEKTIREELNWDTPRRMKVPFLRWDCRYGALINKSYKKAVGIAKNAAICNWFVQTGFVSKKELEADMQYLNDDKRIEKEVQMVFDELRIPSVDLL